MARRAMQVYYHYVPSAKKRKKKDSPSPFSLDSILNEVSDKDKKSLVGIYNQVRGNM